MAKAGIIKEWCNVLMVSKSHSKFKDEWILDSGFSFHMSHNRDWFPTYHFVDGGVVLMRNNAPCNVIRIGTIHIKMFDGLVYILTNV